MFGGTRHWVNKGQELYGVFTLDPTKGERHPCTVVPPVLVMIPLVLDSPLSLVVDLALLPVGVLNELLFGAVDVERKGRVAQGSS